MAQRTCSVPGCPESPRSRNAKYCGMHQQRVRKDGVPGEPGRRHRRYQPGDHCEAKGCPEPPKSKGLCNLHYHRLQDTGDPGEPERRKGRRGGGYITPTGYVKVGNGGRQFFEHRQIIEKQLGRPLLPEESVHHKNGIRHDNRPENLELWVSWGKQPKGQRVADLLAFVVERYPEQVARMLRRQRRSGKPPEHPTLW